MLKHSICEITVDAAIISRRIKELGIETEFCEKYELVTEEAPQIIYGTSEMFGRVLAGVLILQKSFPLLIFGSAKRKHVSNLGADLQALVAKLSTGELI